MGSEWLVVASTVAAFVFAYLYTSYRYDDKLHKAFKIMFLSLTIIFIMYSFFLMYAIAVLAAQQALADTMVTFFVINGILTMLILFIYGLDNIKRSFESVSAKRREPNI